MFSYHQLSPLQHHALVPAFQPGLIFTSSTVCASRTRVFEDLWTWPRHLPTALYNMQQGRLSHHESTLPSLHLLGGPIKEVLATTSWMAVRTCSQLERDSAMRYALSWRKKGTQGFHLSVRYSSCGSWGMLSLLPSDSLNSHSAPRGNSAGQRWRAWQLRCPYRPCHRACPPMPGMPMPPHKHTNSPTVDVNGNSIADTSICKATLYSAKLALLSSCSNKLLRII